MPYCARCRLPGAPAVAIYTSDGPDGHRQAGACATHLPHIRAWAAETGGPVHERRIHAPTQPTRPEQDQLNLFTPQGTTA